MDTLGITAGTSVTVTSEELIVLTQLLGLEGFPGLEPVSTSNEELSQLQLILEQGIRSLIAHGAVEANPQGTIVLNTLLHQLVIIAGQAERSLCVFHIRPDGTTEGYFDHWHEHTSVIHHRPIDGIHHLTLNPDPGACIEQIIAFCGCARLITLRVQPLAIAETLFMEARRIAASGDVLGATKSLTNGGVPRIPAGLLATTFASTHDVYSIVLIRKLPE
jgi:hypothetical protein